MTHTLNALGSWDISDSLGEASLSHENQCLKTQRDTQARQGSHSWGGREARSAKLQVTQPCCLAHPAQLLLALPRTPTPSVCIPVLHQCPCHNTHTPSVPGTCRAAGAGGTCSLLRDIGLGLLWTCTDCS